MPQVTRLNPVTLPFGKQIDFVAEFSLPGPLPLDLVRSYKPAFLASGPLGPGYATALDLTITDGPDSGTYAVATLNGIEVIFDRPAPQLFAQSRNDGHKHLALEPLSRAGLKLHDRRQATIYQRFPGRIWRAIAIEDRNGNRLVLHRDAQGVLLALDHPGGLRLEFQNDGGGLRLGYDLISPNGHRQAILRYGYDSAGRLISAQNTCGESWTYGYDEVGNRVLSDNGAGTRTRHVFDDLARVIAVDTGGSYKHGRIDYAPHGRQVTVWHGTDGSFEKMWFDTEDRLSFISDPAGRFAHKRYSADHELIEDIDANGASTRYSYDAQGNLQSVIDPEGRESMTVWTEDGQPLIEITPEGQQTRYAYDERGNLSGITSALGHMTDITCNAAGQPIRIMRHDGLMEVRDYDERQRLIRVIDFNGARTEFAYDDFNRLISVTDAEGHITRLAYDPMEGRGFATPSRVLRPDGVETRRSFNSTGTLQTITDGEGRVTRYDYGPYNVLETITDPKGNTLRFGYDSRERLVRVTNQMGLHWTFARDLAGRVTQETDFDGRVLRYAYDDAGRLIRRDNPDGARLEYSYDASGLLTALQAYAPGATTPEITEYGYDGNGALIAALNATAQITIERDALGRVVAETVNGQRIESTIDCCGRRVRRQIGDQVLDLGFDGMGGLRHWQLAGHASLVFDRNANGQEVARHTGTGFGLAQQWDSVGQLRQQSGPGLARSYDWSRSYDPLTIRDSRWGERRYTYDVNGQILRTDHGDGSAEVFAYTPDLNLAGAGPDAERFLRWQTSRAGVVKLARGPQGEAITLEHDACGRVTRRTIARRGFRSQTWQFGWNAQDQLVSSRGPDGHLWQYGYDPFGRRIFKACKSLRHDYLWDGDVVAREDRSDRAAPVEWFYEADTFRPMARREGGTLFYIVTDHLGTPKEALTEAGHLVWSVDHSTWGTLRIPRRVVGDEDYWLGETEGDLPNHTPAPEADFCPIRFQGQWEDAETGLYYNRFRYYEPGVGQYLSGDPIGLLGGVAPHSYVLKPTIFVDPFGLAPTTFKFSGSILCIVQKFPVGSAEAAQLGDFVKLWNDKITQIGGSMTTQSITPDMAKLQDKWRRDFRSNNCCKGVAGHVPDCKMGNCAYPPLTEGMDQLSATNSYLGGIARHVPVGVTYASVKLVGSLSAC